MPGQPRLNLGDRDGDGFRRHCRLRQPPVDEVEQIARRVRSRREALGGRRIVRDRRGHSREDANHPLEVAAHVRPRRARPRPRRWRRISRARTALRPPRSSPRGGDRPPAAAARSRAGRAATWNRKETLKQQNTAKGTIERSMPQPPDLKASLKRGAFVAAANWPLVAVQFIAEGTLKLLLAVPVVGGIVLVVLLLGADVDEIMAGDTRQIVASVFGALRANPAALMAFGAAFGLVMLGGSLLTFAVKGGHGRDPRRSGGTGRTHRTSAAAPRGAQAREPRRDRAVSRRLPDVLAPLREARPVPARWSTRRRRSSFWGSSSGGLRSSETWARSSGSRSRRRWHWARSSSGCWSSIPSTC